MNFRLRPPPRRTAVGKPSLAVGPAVRRISLLAALVLATGCAGGAKPRGPNSETARAAAATQAALTADCEPLAGAVAAGTEPVFGLSATVDPRRAPVPHNLAERVVFRNLYETLVQVDCAGDLQPALAESWERRNDGALWIFTLREGAVFWDGTPVTAAAVAACWAYTQSCPRDSDLPSPWNWLSVRAESVVVLGARHLAVELPEASDDLPYLLAHPSLAIAAKRDGWTWPVGSGPCRLSATTPEPLPDLVCRPNIHHPDHPRWHRFTFRVLPSVDPRDLPAHGADLLLVTAQTDREHIGSLAEFVLAPLPWDRLYLLVTPRREGAEPAPGEVADDWFRYVDTAALARDALDRDARAWETLLLAPLSDGDCAQLTGPVTANTVAPLAWDPARLGASDEILAFPRDDAGAAQLAERLAVLQGVWRAVGLEPDHFGFALNERQAAGYVVAVDRGLPTACLQLAGLLGRASWLQAVAAGGATESLSVGVAGGMLSYGSAGSDAPGIVAVEQHLRRAGLVRPLVAVRHFVAARRGVAGLKVAWDGTPLVAEIGLAAAPRELP